MEFGSERFHAPRGLADWIDLFSDDRGPRFQAVVTSGFHIIHAAAAGSSDATLWHSWVNGRPSPEHGVHVTGFRNALGRCRWKPRAAAIHVAVGSARFAGATRDKLVNGDVALGVEQALLPLIQAALHSGGM